MEEYAVSDRLAQKLYALGQYVVIAVFGLLPIFFLPIAGLPTSYTKVVVVIIGLLAALILYSFSVLRSGVLKLSLPLPLAALWLIVVASVASALLSGDFSDAFFGDSIESQTALFVAVVALSATVVMQLMTEKAAVMRLYLLLSISTLALALFHVLRLVFGSTAISLGIFGGDATLSPIGSWNDLAIFFGLAILLALVALEQVPLTKWGKILFSVVVGASLIMLAVINFSPVWMILGIVSLIVLVYALAKDRFTPEWLNTNAAGKRISGISIGISGAVFAVSVFFILGGSALGGVVSNMTGISYIEIRPSVEATADITREVYKSQPIFGTGPNKFVDAWRQYKDPSINNTIFWNTDFLAGVGYIPTFFITTGIIGGLLWLVFLGLFIVAGVRMLFAGPAQDTLWYFIAVSSFVSAVYLWGLSIIYVPGAALILLAALCTGVTLAARNALDPSRERPFSLLGKRHSGFVLVTITMLLVVGSVSALYWVGRNYLATYTFAQSIDELNAGNIDASEALTASAYTLSPDDRYARRVAEIQLARLVALLNEQNPTADVQARFQNLLVGAINAGRTATEADMTEANNWGVLGNIYAVVAPLQIEGSYEQAKDALERARSLDPKNPARVLALARLAYAHNDEATARALIQESIALKQNYTDAIYFLSQIEVLRGNIEAAITSTEATISLEPDNPVRYFQLGVLEVATNDLNTAALAFERAVGLNPSYANAHYYLAFVYDRLGRRDDARRELQAVLSTNPENAEVQDLLRRIDNGQRISDPGAGGANSTPVAESDDEPGVETPVTDGEAPDSSLLTPVNAVPETAE